MEIDVIHNIIQWPSFVFQAAAAILVGFRAYDTKDLSTAALAFMLACLAAKQGYWLLVWALQASDIHSASDALRANPYIPIALNVSIVLSGGLAVATLGVATLGRASYIYTTIATFAFAAIGAIIALW